MTAPLENLEALHQSYRNFRGPYFTGAGAPLSRRPCSSHVICFVYSKTIKHSNREVTMNGDNIRLIREISKNNPFAVIPVKFRHKLDYCVRPCMG